LDVILAKEFYKKSRRVVKTKSRHAVKRGSSLNNYFVIRLPRRRPAKADH